MNDLVRKTEVRALLHELSSWCGDKECSFREILKACDEDPGNYKLALEMSRIVGYCDGLKEVRMELLEVAAAL